MASAGAAAGNDPVTQVVRKMAPVSATRGHRAMHNLPDWAVSIIAVAVGLSPGLALLIARPIGRFLRRVLFVRGQGDAANRSGSGSRDQADDRSDRHSSLMGT
jgi:hypothetical protein